MKSNYKLLLAVLLVAVVFISGCVQQGNKNPAAGGQTLKGITLSPRSFQQNDFTDFFEKAKQAGGIVSWSGDWNELSDTKSGAPAVVSVLADNYKLVPIVEAQFFSQSGGRLLRPLDAATKEKYKNSAADFAETFKPKYMGFGIEVNALYEKSPADFDAFAQLFSETYDAVKKASPDTKVFTVFQLEKMKGMSGGLFGGANDPSKSEWFLLDKFSKSDMIAFTTYPGLVYKNPSDIPSDYYIGVQSRTSKPVAFTEIGWHSGASPVGWESSEAEQAEFVATFFNLTSGLKKEFVIWSFMYDQNATEPFKSMGLIGGNGVAKKAWNEWIIQT